VRSRCTRGTTTRLVREQRAVALEARGLGLVVRLARELALGLRRQLGEVHVAGQQARPAQRRDQVVDVALDAGRDAGILDLEREDAAVLRDGAVHLADRGRGHGLGVELGEALAPARAELGGEQALELRVRHGVAVGAQHG
jgi:hypothetical protein